MEAKDIFKGEQYRLGTIVGPVVTVYSVHQYIDNHYYIKYENGSVNTSQRERLFPLKYKWTNHVSTWTRHPDNKTENRDD